MSRAKKWADRAVGSSCLGILSLCLMVIALQLQSSNLSAFKPEALKMITYAALASTGLFAFLALLFHFANLTVTEEEKMLLRRKKNQERAAALETEMAERRLSWQSRVHYF